MLVLFIVFTVSERMMRAEKQDSGLEQFNLDVKSDVSADTMHVRPGCVLVAVRDYNRMEHLQSVLNKDELRKHDIVVMSCAGFPGQAAANTN